MIDRPEHDFTQDCEAWEQSVLDNATYFTTARFLGGVRYDRREFKTLAEACNDARDDASAMVCAVADSGRNVYVPLSKWPSEPGAA